MKVLTVFAHPGQGSFCHAVLQRFDAGLKEAGHTNEIVDLYAIGFDPVLKDRDNPNWMDPDAPDEILEQMHLKERIVGGARGPISRLLARLLVAGRDTRGLIRFLQRRFRPRDVAEQQEKVASAQALVFIAPVWFVGFPAILKGWIERVFTLGFAFRIKPEAWRGDISGRVPLLHHEKALIIQTTLFDGRAYGTGLGDAMKVLVDDFGFRYPGIEKVERVFFHAIHGVDDATRRGYLDQAQRLGREF